MKYDAPECSKQSGRYICTQGILWDTKRRVNGIGILAYNALRRLKKEEREEGSGFVRTPAGRSAAQKEG